MLAEERNHVGVELVVEGNAILEAWQGADMHAKSGSNCEKRKIKHTHLAGGAGRVKRVTSRRS